MIGIEEVSVLSRRLTRLDYYINLFIAAVEKISSSNGRYNINPDRQLLNVKPALFKSTLHEIEPNVIINSCLKNFKALGYIKTDNGSNTCLQWTGRKYERVISVNLNVFNKTKELYNRPESETGDING